MPDLIKDDDEGKWFAIRIEYEKTECTVKALAQRFKVSIPEIEQRRAAEKWVRNEQKETMALVASKTVLGDRANDPAPITEQDRLKAISKSADNIIEVLDGHKTAAKSGIAVVTKILTRIVEQNGQVTQYDMMGAGHQVDAVKEIRDLSTALKNFTSIDRVTYGLDDYKGIGSPADMAARGQEDAERRLRLIDQAMVKALNASTRHLKVVS